MEKNKAYLGIDIGKNKDLKIVARRCEPSLNTEGFKIVCISSVCN